ncbi:hypothetical protein C8D87_109141 [Lentzea atacamensis]|uniref:DUF6891 domain-containing protein n=1 Tax=Lentzea atacamensis TaxID=531938 RepID=A0ABX9E072_9PSEU|nr:hypothetical protein C8D87_109141 [Lentzea atacamensis]
MCPSRSWLRWSGESVARVTGFWWFSGYPTCPTSSSRSGTRPVVTTSWSILPRGAAARSRRGRARGVGGAGPRGAGRRLRLPRRTGRAHTEYPTPVSRAQAQALADRLWLERVVEQTSWQGETDPERLTRAFAALQEAGMTARENFTCCHSCGQSEIGGEGGSDARGFAYSHTQCTDSAAAGHGLTLLYGGFDGSSETTAAIGHEVVAPSGSATPAGPSPSVLWTGAAAWSVRDVGTPGAATPRAWRRGRTA